MAYFCIFLLAVKANPVVPSVKINCDFYMSTGKAHTALDKVYYCTATGLEVNSPITIVDGVEGTHEHDKTNDDVKMLYMFSSPNMMFMPKGIEICFGHLERLGITNTGLVAITQNDLKPFPNLLVLYLSGNKLVSLDSGLFSFNPKVKYIDFDDNKLSSIAADIFDTISDLEAVKLKGNVCISRDGLNRSSVSTVKREIIDLCQSMTAE